jgi:general secretion pathway protein A
MYREHFGLREPPFSIAPDPRFLYMSEQHREAMAHLVYGMNTDGGFVLLTGDVGTGKTTICRGLLEQKQEDTDIAFILNPKVSAEELLAAICDELGIGYPEGNTSVKVFVDNINTYLLRAYAVGRKTVLIIEEAQNLRPEVLEQVRLLTNLETNQQKLLKIIMIGQPELKEMLLRADMEQLSQRITARYHIGPLTRNEVGGYVNHRLLVAGGRKRLFPDSVFGSLYRLSRGVPRLINVICDRALLGAYVQGKDAVDRKTLIKASREIFGKPGIQKGRRRITKWMVASLLLMGCGAAITAAFYGGFYGHTIHSKLKTAEVPVASATPIEIKNTDMLEWPSGQPIERSKEAACRALFEEWNISYQMQKDDDVCTQARANGLRCLNGSSSLKELILLNRPAVLKLLNGKGKEFYITLRRIEGQSAVLVVGQEKRVVDSKELEKRWSGDYLLFWRAPENYNSNIHPGDKGAQIGWLERYLSSVQGKKPQPKSPLTYDDDLVRRVKKFQLEEGLITDGIVGPQTIIHLVNKKGTEEPLLTVDKDLDK